MSHFTGRLEACQLDRRKCRCKMRMSGLSKVEMSGFMVGRGRTSNRNLVARLGQKILSRVRQRYADFGPTLAAEHLAVGGIAGEPRDAAELDGEGQLVASPGATRKNHPSVAGATSQFRRAGHAG